MNAIQNHSKNISILYLVLLISGCNVDESKVQTKLPTDSLYQPSNVHLVNDIPPLNESGEINVVVEIPAGTMQKWEVDKIRGGLKWDEKNGTPRIINYLGYPANYGMIPQTYLPKSLGGDGDPLDVVVIGPSVKRGVVIQAKVIGVLKLLDHGEMDDKLIAVSKDSPLFHVNSITELDSAYNGISNIIQLWFENYKGPDIMVAHGFGNKETADTILNTAIEAFNDK